MSRLKAQGRENKKTVKRRKNTKTQYYHRLKTVSDITTWKCRLLSISSYRWQVVMCSPTGQCVIASSSQLPSENVISSDQINILDAPPDEPA